MRNNRMQIPKQKFWPNFKHWLYGLNLRQEPKDHITSINLWFDAFLSSDDADDREIRLEVMAVRDEMLNLFTMLDYFPEEVRKSKLNEVVA